VIWIAALLVVIVLGVLVQHGAERRDVRRHPAPGRLLTAGDVRLHVMVDGDGPPVLIDSGLGGSSIEWSRVAGMLAPDFTVIRYDRPGLAWSPAARCDRRTEATACRIIALIEELAAPAPVILVGHSLGGIHVRAVAALRPDLVGSLVLVDPSHEGMLETAEASKAAGVFRAITRIVALTAPIGLGRLTGRAFASLAMSDRRKPLQGDDAEAARLGGLLTLRTVHGLRAVAAEYGCLEASLQQFVTLTRQHPEPRTPVTVITAAAPSKDARTAKAREQIDAMHAELVAANPQSRQVLAPESGHLVPLDSPEVIVQSVRDTAAAMRAGGWSR
jgi:pimeloyl-ACP methyl ester carboxylesterase